MQMKPTKFHRKQILLFVVTVLIVLIAIWLKSQHQSSTAISAAKQFIQHLQAKEFNQAFILVKQPSLAGSNLQAFEIIVKNQFGDCTLNNVASVFPFQSNGNRLRRLFTGKPIEMAEITVDFAGSCLFSVTLHHQENGLWQVFKFQSHAG